MNSSVDKMLLERERLKTFDNWPLPFPEPERFAKNGFYYVGRNDEVRCAFCKVEIVRWLENDDPEQEHRRWVPQCPFLKAKESGRRVIPLDEDECLTTNTDTNIVHMTKPVHPYYALESARLLTFWNWPISLQQTPEQLVEAGFFYSGRSDFTQCFYCGGGLRDWKREDDPWQEHAQWYPNCAFVLLLKGKDYVQKVTTETCEVKSPAPSPPPVELNDKTATIRDEHLCVICCSEKRDVALIPCGHVAVCARCIVCCDQCPICRKLFTGAIRLYYS